MKHQLVQLPSASAKQVLLATNEEESERAKRPKFPMPDTEQMLPFKPRAVVRK